MAIILPYKGKTPQISPEAYIADNAVIIGDVVIGPQASVWFNCVLRGDVHYIKVGARTNIQDGTIIHVSRNDGPTIIGSGITIGHKALLHACILEDDCFIGMGAQVLDNAIVQTGGMVAAGALVTFGKKIPKGEIWAGSPAKFFRPLSLQEQEHIGISANNYVELAAVYRN